MFSYINDIFWIGKEFIEEMVEFFWLFVRWLNFMDLLNLVLNDWVLMNWPKQTYIHSFIHSECLHIWEKF